MKRGGSAVVALLGSLLGCTAPQPSFLDELEVRDPEMAALGEPAIPGAQRQLQEPPEVEAPPVEPTPSTDPPHVVVSTEWPESDDEEQYKIGCPVWITATGFPAISADGTTIVLDEFEVDDASTDEMDGVRTIRWLDTETGAGVQAETLTDGSAYFEAQRKHPDADPCVPYIAQAKRAARAINRTLATQTWRPLPKLDIVLSDPYEELDEEPLDLRSIDASIRPVEIYWKDDRLIARTPGVKVYLDLPAPWGNERAHYDPDEDEAFDVGEYSPCDYEPAMRSVHGDPISGVLLVEYDYGRYKTSCLCESYSYTELVQARPALFERLDRLASRKPPPPAD